MSPVKEKQIPAIADLIDIDSDGEDGGPVVSAGVSRINSNRDPNPSIRAKLQTKPVSTTQSASVVYTGGGSGPLGVNNSPLENRSFWRAGDYGVGPTVSTLIQGDLEHARVHPKFLHSNATSHKWAFGAIAELLDNAVDEIINGATFVKVDRVYNKKDNSPALLFQDDGGGMDPDSMRKCMSLGYSSKKSSKTIGQYGNGFKTSTMRLGADVIVFSRSAQSGRATQSIGLLSYTFLRRTRQDDVIVPMIDFDISDNWAEPIIYSSKDDWSSNLKTIIEWSPFASKDDLMYQFENIGPHGTKVVIYNLWMNDEGVYELNFDDDEEDIKLRDEVQANVSKTFKRVLELQSHLSYRMRFSLRAYASILYLRKFTNFNIILRGKPVEQYSIADDLKHSNKITYSPQVGMGLKEVNVETTVGFINEAPALTVNGFNVYHKNRLIRPYWKVTADGNSKGHGVVGVLEANFIEPAHDKQDFERSTLFNKLELKLKQIVSDYWKAHHHLLGHQSNTDSTRKINTQNKSTAVPEVEVISENVYGTRVNEKSAKARLDSGPQTAVPEVEVVSENVYETRVNEKSAKARLDSGPQTASSPHLKMAVDNSSLNQICEENIQLFMRSEEYKAKQVEKIRTIGELEKELKEMREKSARLSSDLEAKRKQKIAA